MAHLMQFVKNDRGIVSLQKDRPHDEANDKSQKITQQRNQDDASKVLQDRIEALQSRNKEIKARLQQQTQLKPQRLDRSQSLGTYHHVLQQVFSVDDINLSSGSFFK